MRYTNALFTHLILRIMQFGYFVKVLISLFIRDRRNMPY